MANPIVNGIVVLVAVVVVGTIAVQHDKPAESSDPLSNASLHLTYSISLPQPTSSEHGLRYRRLQTFSPSCGDKSSSGGNATMKIVRFPVRFSPIQTEFTRSPVQPNVFTEIIQVVTDAADTLRPKRSLNTQLTKKAIDANRRSAPEDSLIVDCDRAKLLRDLDEHYPHVILEGCHDPDAKPAGRIRTATRALSLQVRLAFNNVLRRFRKASEQTSCADPRAAREVDQKLKCILLSITTLSAFRRNGRGCRSLTSSQSSRRIRIAVWVPNAPTGVCRSSDRTSWIHLRWRLSWRSSGALLTT